MPDHNTTHVPTEQAASVALGDPSRVRLQDRQVTVDGEPDLILAGEIHYFRLDRQDWAFRLELLIEAGGDTVSSYIPWVVHEQADGTVDLTGAVRPELDLGAFIDLCAERGLRFLARPGPFVMAELRHEGLPERLYHQHPQIRPFGWDRTPAPTATVDYLAPAFLSEVQGWYQQVGAVLAPRMADRGGPVVAVQLDNEVGMLSWVSNSPDLTDDALTDLLGHVRLAHGETIGRQYPTPTAAVPWPLIVRSPQPAWAAALRQDLADFSRLRFARYVATLRGYAESAGFGTVPLLVNIHGTEAGSAASFPIGISQLMATYRDQPGMTAGSDHYLGTLTWPGAAELHMVHQFMLAVQGPDQPLTSLEFEAGDGDYGGDQGAETDPTSVVLKTRLLLAQGTRMFNWYLFSGGQNLVDPRPDDAGTHRFGITGQRHGAAAPVTPEGARGTSFASTAEAMAVARVHAPWAARWTPETDQVYLGFVPDHYAVEYRYPGNPVMQHIADQLAWARGAGPRNVLPRALLGAGIRYNAVDLQTDLVAEVGGKVIVLGSPELLDRAEQQRLADHVHRGGRLVLVGALPVADLQGRPCTVLADALGIAVTGLVTSGPGTFPSILGDGPLTGMPETRVSRMQFLHPMSGTVLLRDAITGNPCGVQVSHGAGDAVVLATDHPIGPTFLRDLLQRWDVRPGLTHDSQLPGLFSGSTVCADGARFVQLANIGGHVQRFRMSLDGEPLFGGEPLELAARTGAILPVGVQLGGHRLDWSTAELVELSPGAVAFREGGGGSVVCLDGVVTRHPAGSGTFRVTLD